MILTYLCTNSALLIKLIASNLIMWAEARPQDTCHLLENLPLPKVGVEWEVLGDQWRNIAQRKSHKYCKVISRVPKVYCFHEMGCIKKLDPLAPVNKGC